MTANTVAAQTAYAAVPAEDGMIELETRFGVISFDRANAIFMPRGLLGYSEYHEFALGNLPDPKLCQFKLLQCMTHPSISFVVAPANLQEGAIEPADIEAACRTLGATASAVAVLLVVATRRIGPATQVSVNLRAPIIVDLPRQTAWQFVMPNNRYPVRHVIGTFPQASAAAG